jgi:CBS domain-containing protein
MTDTPLPHLVRDLMTVGVVTCTPQTTVPELAQLLLNHDLDELIVLDEGQALGVIAQEDLVAAFTLDNAQSLTAAEVMREGVPQVPPDIPLKAAAQIMQDHGVRTLYLMHHAGGIEYPAAAITFKHYLRFLAANDPQDLRDLGINSERIPPVETFIQRRDSARKKNIRTKG